MEALPESRHRSQGSFSHADFLRGENRDNGLGITVNEYAKRRFTEAERKGDNAGTVNTTTNVVADKLPYIRSLNSCPNNRAAGQLTRRAKWSPSS